MRIKKVIKKIEELFTYSEPEEVSKFDAIPEMFIGLVGSRVLLADFWGRHTIVDYNKKKLIPVDDDFVEAFMNMRHKVPSEYADFISITREPFKNEAVANSLFLDRTIERKIFVTNKDGILSMSRDLYSHRHVFSNMYGQAPLSPSSNTFRILKIMDVSPPPARVLLIGDNDWISIILAKLGYETHIIDVDPFVTKMLLLLAEKFGVEINVYIHDARRNFEFEEPFDIFITDPEHTPACLYVFVLRGLQNLKIGGMGFVSWEKGFTQRKLFRETIKNLKAKIIDTYKNTMLYISPLIDFYEHIEEIKPQNIRFNIPRWGGDLWVIRKTEETPNLGDFVASLY